MAPQATRHQYQTIVNGSKSPVTDAYPVNWSEIAQHIEDRGGKATLERRLVTEYDPEFLAGLVSTQGFIILPNKNLIICNWDVIAEVEA